MVRLLGAVLVAGGAAWAGLSAAEGLKRRVRALDALVDGLSLLEQELELDSPPLPELFQGCRESLDRLSREPFSQSWRRLTETLPGLDEEARRALSPLGDTLGRCDWNEQRRRVDAICRRVDELRVRAEERQRRQGKVYRALGAAGGAFLVILLL